MKQSHKTILLWISVILLFVILHEGMNKRIEAVDKISFGEFVTLVKEKKVKPDSVTFEGQHKITGEFLGDKAGKKFQTLGLTQSEFYQKFLQENGITPTVKEEEQTPLWQSILISWLPMLLLLIPFLLFIRQIQVGGGKAMSFGKSRAQLLNEGSPKVTFKDVAGVEEAKDELAEIIDFLKDPKKYTKLGGRIPKGVLLVGPPGTGKTLLARAVAGEAGRPFFSISGSDFVEMFVGVGASRVRDLFEQGKKHAPCIIFIDEIDAVGRHRGAGLGGGHDEREQTLNQLLVEMDGFQSNDGVIIIAATNRPDVLDPALLRPGRFDRRVVVSKPDVAGREAILKVHMKRTKLDTSVDVKTIARGTPGFSGADLESLVNEAALLAARRSKTSVSMEDMEAAKDKVLMGSERRSMVISDEEKRATAYHEAGHALVAKLIPGMDPIHKVTIIPRGQALGLTQTLPTDERLTFSKEKAENTIAFMMGGRIAEELILGQKTTGAGNDIERATELARKMTCEWGMSDRFGPVTFGKREEHIFLGREIDRHQEYSEKTAVLIDEEIMNTVQRQYDRAKRLLQENLDVLHNMAKSLIEHETLDSDEIDAIVRGEKILSREEKTRRKNEGQPAQNDKEKVKVDGMSTDPVTA
jgi:cell division protease FtsH